jgi:type IV secretion system protein VirB3
MARQDSLYVACTRPPMKWGVPYKGFILNGAVTTVIVMLFIQSPPGYLLGVGIHLAMRELCRTDPHFFHKWSLWMKTRAKAMTVHVWGGSCLQPSYSKIKAASEMRVSV